MTASITFKRLPPLLVAALLVACSPPDPPGTAVTVTDSAPDPEIVGKLEEIVELRQREFETGQLLAELGKGNADGTAALALADAKIALAREQGQGELVVAELRNLVKSYRQTFNRAKALTEEDRQKVSDLNLLRAKLLEAEVSLRRELLDQNLTE